MYSYRFAVQHLGKLFEMSSVCLDALSDSCDLRICNFTKHCCVVDASCTTENSLCWFFSCVQLVCIRHSFHVTPHMII